MAHRFVLCFGKQAPPEGESAYLHISLFGLINLPQTRRIIVVVEVLWRDVQKNGIKSADISGVHVIISRLPCPVMLPYSEGFIGSLIK